MKFWQNILYELFTVNNHPQMSFLLLSGFEQNGLLLFLLKSSGNRSFSDDLRGNKS